MLKLNIKLLQCLCLIMITGNAHIIDTELLQTTEAAEAETITAILEDKKRKLFFLWTK